MKKVAIALALVLAALLLAACGGSSGSTEPAGGAETGAAEAGSEEGGGAESEAGEEEGGEEAAGGGTTVKFVVAESGFAYTSETATVEAGDVTIELENPQPVEHDVAIESFNGEVLGQTETIAEGTTSTEIELKPGTYHFFCTVPGHRDAGMEGTLTVE